MQNARLKNQFLTQITADIFDNKSAFICVRFARICVQNLCYFFGICALSFVIASGVSFAQTVSSSDLINNSKVYDGKTVTYRGEAIGEVMARGNFAWVNLHDGARAIGVWLPRDMAVAIRYTGSYASRGDVVEISGEFHRSCLEHGGDLDIHGRRLTVVRRGSPVKEIVSTTKQRLATILIGVVVCLGILKRLLDKYRKK